jgi:hypothetical protein
MAKLVAHEPTCRATKQRRPEAPLTLRSYRTRLSLLVWRCTTIVRGALAASWRVLLLLGRVGRVAAIQGRLSVSRTTLGRVRTLLVLWGVPWVALAALLIIWPWVLAVLGLTVRLLALQREKLVWMSAVRVREESESFEPCATLFCARVCNVLGV